LIAGPVELIVDSYAQVLGLYGVLIEYPYEVLGCITTGFVDSPPGVVDEVKIYMR
jgi:hypothetical protein